MENLNHKELYQKIKKKEVSLSDLPIDMQMNQDLAIASLLSGKKLQSLPVALLSNLDVVCVGVKSHWDKTYQEILPLEIQTSPEFLLASLSRLVLKDWKTLPERLKQDKEFFKKALVISERVYSYASQDIQQDKAMMASLVQKNKSLYFEFPKSLKDDKKIVLNLIKAHPGFIGSLPKKWLQDKDIILSLVRRDGTYLERVSQELRDDEEIVMSAIKNNPNCIFYASNRLKNKPSVILRAMKTGFNALKYAGEDLRNNLEFMFLIIQKNIKFMTYCGDTLKSELGDTKEPLIEMERLMLTRQLSHAENHDSVKPKQKI